MAESGGYELKPCPFCGNVAPKLHTQRWPVDDRGNYDKAFWVRCGKCRACSHEYKVPEKAAEAWNRRAGDE